MEKTVSDIITNSIGAVAVAVVFLWYIDRQDQRQQELLERHIGRLVDATNKMSNVITKLINTVSRNGKKNKK